jgi:Fe(3+) dicitrate transport protein
MQHKLRIRTKIVISLLVLLTCIGLFHGPQANGQDRPKEEADQTSPFGTSEAEEKSPVLPSKQQGPEAPREEPLRVPLTEVIGIGPEALEHIPGSGRVVTQKEIWENHRMTVNETLRDVPGVNVRDEEGLGLRPNIGIRGLDPTRSRKVHIMEDGVPIMLMPYGDPSAYYFPPIFRFDRIEVLKGSGQLLYGPQSIGGVMNFITKMPPLVPQGNLEFRGGNLNYFNTHFDYGGTWGKSGYIVDYTHFQSDSPRFTNNRVKVDDITFKTVQEISDRTTILAKFNYYGEESKLGYQGLTEADWGARGSDRYTFFTNDKLEFRRLGAHVAVQHMFNASLSMTTNFFGHYIARDWKRQNQQGVDINGNPVGASVTGNNIPATSFSVVPADQSFTNSREYWVYGVEPRFHLTYRLFGIANEADFGARAMYEQSDRKQFLNQLSGIGGTNTCFPANPGDLCLNENNVRNTAAYSLFFQNRFLVTDQITITPGFRVEHVNYDQYNKRNPPTEDYSKTNLTEVLPGIGATYSPFKNYTFFAGVHRGFAPPSISDAITGAFSPGPSGINDLDSELSWNYELGLRSTPLQWLGYELTLFEMDFQNQIVSQSVAGGAGATLTNAGRTRHRGIEFAVKADVFDMVRGHNNDHDVIFDVNYTWLADAEFRGERNSSITGAALLPDEAAVVSVTGNRLPYAPKNMITAGLGYTNRPVGFNARIETQCISDMFADDRNLHNPTPNGYRGIIRGWCAVNAAVNQYVKSINTTFYVVGKNLLDNLYMVDRSRGIYPGLPLMVQAGARWTF